MRAVREDQASCQYWTRKLYINTVSIVDMYCIDGDKATINLTDSMGIDSITSMAGRKTPQDKSTFLDL